MSPANRAIHASSSKSSPYPGGNGLSNSSRGGVRLPAGDCVLCTIRELADPIRDVIGALIDDRLAGRTSLRRPLVAAFGTKLRPPAVAIDRFRPPPPGSSLHAVVTGNYHELPRRIVGRDELLEQLVGVARIAGELDVDSLVAKLLRQSRRRPGGVEYDCRVWPRRRIERRSEKCQQCFPRAMQLGERGPATENPRHVQQIVTVDQQRHGALGCK